MTTPLARPRKSWQRSLESTEFAVPHVALMSSQAIEAEKLAAQFGLGYLSRDGFQKLADLLEFCAESCTCEAHRAKLRADVIVSKSQRW